MQSYKIQCFLEPLALSEEPDPQPAGTEVLLGVQRCGICHSDLYVHAGRINLGGGKFLNLADRGVAPPITLGHEVLGTILAHGPEAQVPSELKGRPVIAYPWLGCGMCGNCVEGHAHLCDKPNAIGIGRPGGYATRCMVPHPRYLVAADGIAPSFAAILACSGLTAYSAIKKLAAHGVRDDILIIGAGGLGLLALQVARALGFTRIGVADIGAAKRQTALNHGASYVIDPAKSKGLPSVASTRITGVVDFVGSDETASFAMATLSKGGAYIAVGLYGGSLVLALPVLIQRSIAVIGSYVGSLHELREVVQLARTGELTEIPMEDMDLSEVNAGLSRLRNGEVAGRLVLNTTGSAT